MSSIGKNNHDNKHEAAIPSNFMCNLSDFFQEFELEDGHKGALKLKQIIDHFCYVLGQTVSIFITNHEGKILYQSDVHSYHNELRQIGIIKGDHIKIEAMLLSNQLPLGKELVTSEDLALPLSDSELVYLRSFISPISKDDNEISHYIIAFHDVTKERLVESQLSTMHYVDPLTQLPNRRSFEEDLFQELQKKDETPFALFFLDLDRFKFFNDTLGHTIGDDLIIKIASALCELENEQRISLYRFGGDEFTFLFRDFEQVSEIEVLAKRILSLFKNPFSVQGNELILTCSIGISTYPHSSTSFKRLVDCADTAMHYAKERGKDTYQIFSENMNTEYSEKLKMEAYLRKALDQNQFFLYYQPQVDLKTKKIIGVEALIRWIHPELGFIPPNEFIPLAEESGLIDPIGDWVLKTACQKVKTWQVEKGLNIRVGINISPKQFQRPDFVSKVERVLKETGLEAKYVDLEITENGLMQNSIDCLQTLDRLKQKGVKISIDDFGTGYSSLSYLKRFPIDTLKIDQSFVRDLIDDTNDQAIVTSIINLAHNMKLNVIAEGVETTEIVEFLNLHQCDEMQGYIYSKPLPPHEFEIFVTNIENNEKVGYK